MVDLNHAEAQLMEDCPGITRLSSHLKPRFITVVMKKNHNPDFKLFLPEEGRGYIVELKGHIQDRLFLPMLEHFPPALKKIYKVVLVERSMKERAKVKRRLDKIGISWYDDTINPAWIVEATRLYTGLDKLTDQELAELKSCLNHFPDKTN